MVNNILEKETKDNRSIMNGSQLLLKCKIDEKIIKKHSEL